MDQLTRIEKLLERIAVALEKHGETKLDWPTFEPCRIHPEDLQGTLTGADPSVATDQWQHLRYDPIRDVWLNKKETYNTEIKYSTDTTHLRQRFGNMDRFHSGGIGGGLREGEIPAILSRGHAADGRWYGPCEPPKPEDFTILDKGEDVLGKEDAPKGTEHIRQRFGIDYSMMGDGDG